MENSVDFPDEFIGRHFGHHTRFEIRHPTGRWRFRRVRVPSHELRCLYADPGVKPENPAGLMGSVGLQPTGHQDRPIAEMASAIRHALTSSTADTQNPALAKVLAFRELGTQGIARADEPLALSRLNGRWYVREGTHRAVALALLGEGFVEGIDFESGELFK